MLLVIAAIGSLLYVAFRQLGIAPHDVLLVFAVGLYATYDYLRGRNGSEEGGGGGDEDVLLGEDSADSVQIRWGDFVREHHQLLGCVLQSRRTNRRSRSERILSLAVTTLALLYWKAVFRTPKVSMHSLEGLRTSLWTLLVSKGVQLLMKLGIRAASRRTAAWQEKAGWLDALHLQWQIAQYWTLGFMMLCVFLALLEGRNWASLLSTWLIQMLYALIFFDLAFTFIKYKLLGFYLDKRRAAMRHRSR